MYGGRQNPTFVWVAAVFHIPWRSFLQSDWIAESPFSEWQLLLLWKVTSGSIIITQSKLFTVMDGSTSDMRSSPGATKHESRRGDLPDYHLRHVWNKLLLTDARNRKLVLTKTSDRRSKRRSNFGCVVIFKRQLLLLQWQLAKSLY